jgi:pantothenate kinase
LQNINREDLVQKIQSLSQHGGRTIVAIAGPPGSGKSTIALQLADALGEKTAVLPMDGFHLDNSELEKVNLLHRKGAPETFDAEGFAQLLQKIRHQAVVEYPTFDREADKTVFAGGKIETATETILVEGNYLLLNDSNWAAAQEIFDLTISLEVSRSELEQRLINRWLSHGLNDKEARARVHGNDMLNVDLVLESSNNPDYILQTE